MLLALLLVLLLMLILALTSVASTELLGEARANFNWTVGVRRKLHATPELLYELDKTSALVRATLDELKIPYQWPVARQGIVATLGSGSFAVVHHGTYQFPRHSKVTPVAFKVFKEQLTSKLAEDTRKEVEMGAQLQHKHLVRLFGVLRLPGNKVALMLELAEGGSLRQVLDDRDRFPSSVGGSLRTQVVSPEPSRTRLGPRKIRGKWPLPYARRISLLKGFSMGSVS